MIKIWGFARINLMKKLIGVLVIASALAVGLYSYSRLLDSQNGTQNLPPSTPATISEPLTTESGLKNEPLPELGSFKGLEEESTNLLNGIDSLPQNKTSDPLKNSTE